jgi:hypothetical protein
MITCYLHSESRADYTVANLNDAEDRMYNKQKAMGEKKCRPLKRTSVHIDMHKDLKLAQT